jgi:uncharacterized PurR-regulated membrane protein YhhQ (DUF165 family)
VRTRHIVILLVLLAGLIDFAANYLAANYLLSIGTFLIPGGTFLFALGFTVYDYLRRFHGLAPTGCAILLGFVASIAWAAVFGGGIGRIAVAGLVALIFSSSTDILAQTVTLRWPIWRYVLTANALSLLVDTVVFTFIAFALLPLDVRLHIVEGQYAAKILMTLVSIPIVYYTRSIGYRRVSALVAA